MNRATEQRIVDILADPEWARRVVIAAVQAEHLLIGPELTPDGDRAEMVARNTLTTAITDLRAITALNERTR